MNVFPATSAWGSIHSGTMVGKLKGTTPATTPSGSWVTSQLMPRDTSICSPAARLGKEAPNSTHSMPLRTEPRAWAMVLPFSWLSSHASSSSSRSMICLTRYRTWARSFMGVAFQAGKAAAAAFAAASTSSAPPKARRPISLPWRGLSMLRV